jgi:hypothetical protein
MDALRRTIKLIFLITNLPSKGLEKKKGNVDVKNDII